MNPLPENDGVQDAWIKDIAARWVVRQDRRLTPAEETELAAWLAADPQHTVAFKQSMAAWHKFREVASAVRREPAATVKSRLWVNWLGVGGLAAAAALVLLAVIRESPPGNAASETNR